jgi:hypothetical protein
MTALQKWSNPDDLDKPGTYLSAGMEIGKLPDQDTLRSEQPSLRDGIESRDGNQRTESISVIAITHASQAKRKKY